MTDTSRKEATRALSAGTKRRRLKLVLGALLTAAVLVPLGARVAVNRAAAGRVYHDPADVPECRVAMVLGARVLPNGKLCSWLEKRCDMAIALYNSGKVEKILMSGDNRFKNYNEPERMRDYAVVHGVPREDIVLDYAGRRTFDSIYRARHIFGLTRLIVVTQDFHVPRAIYLARAVGVDACGLTAPADGKFKSEIRECFACVSAILDVHVIKPKPVMGEKETI